MRRNWLTASIIAIGVASLLSDACYELIIPLLPAFVATLGGGALAVGLIEGVADAVAAGAKLWGGSLADRTSRRRAWTAAQKGHSKSAYSISGTPLGGLNIAAKSWRRGGLGAKALVTLTLRNHVKWSDGSLVTFDDFQFAYDQASRDENRYVQLDILQDIASFRTLDQHTLEVTLKAAVPRDVSLGIVNVIGDLFGIPPIAWLTQKWTAFLAILLTDVWLWTPWFALLLLHKQVVVLSFGTVTQNTAAQLPDATGFKTHLALQDLGAAILTGGFLGLAERAVPASVLQRASNLAAALAPK